MRYYLDTEFFEKPGGRGIPGMIDWISIGIVGEDGREFYAENGHFDWEWVRQAAHIPEVGETPTWLLENVKPHLLGGDYNMDNELAADLILAFMVDDGDEKPEFWGWYCDYDWVVFCWLFGRMIDLPSQFPKFCRDLRQEIERTKIIAKDIPMDGNEHNALADARWNKKVHEAILSA